MQPKSLDLNSNDLLLVDIGGTNIDIYTYSKTTKIARIVEKLASRDLNILHRLWKNELDNFYNFCIKELSLDVIGLMCIPPINENPTKHFQIITNLTKKRSYKSS